VRARILVLAPVLLLLSMTAACGSAGDDETGDADTTTTRRASSTARSSTTTTMHDERRFPPTVTAPVPSQGEPMADGIHAVYLEGVDVAGRTITVDVVQFLTGEEADEAYRTETGEEDGVPNDYFIRNASQDQREVKVAETVTVTAAWDGDDVRQRELAFDELPAYLGGRGVDGNDRVVFWIAIEYEVATELFEQYLP
jgi:hypothetical protein